MIFLIQFTLNYAQIMFVFLQTKFLTQNRSVEIVNLFDGIDFLTVAQSVT